MSRSEFLFTSPREFDALTERLNIKREDIRYNTATLIAAIYNTHCDYTKRPEGFSPEDFLPGKKNLKHQSTEEFALECQKNGYKFTPREEDAKHATDFVNELQKVFNPARIVRVKE